MPTPDPTKFQHALLAWFAHSGRTLPWRGDYHPYRIWLAEIMLQQTTVAAVIPYYQRFLAAFPTVQDLAAAHQQDVLRLWQGLGYYARARNLHACAQYVVAHCHGQFPPSEAALLRLPGVGPYTAAAIAALAFEIPATVVDGNVERVISRLYRLETPLPDAKPRIKQLAATLTSPHQPRNYAGALMDLGATICTPRAPQCPQCPVRTCCAAYTVGDAHTYPRKRPKPAKPTKSGIVWLVLDPYGHLYLQQRTSQRLLHNLWEAPHTGWETPTLSLPPPTQWQELGDISHVFTHFNLKLTVRLAHTTTPHPAAHGFPPQQLPPLPTLMRKVFALLPHAGTANV